MLLTKYKPLVKRTGNEYNIFNTGSDEYMVDILYPLATESGINTIIQLCRLYNGKIKDQNDYYDNIRNKLEECLKTKDIILIGRGTEYDGYDNFFILTTLQEISNKIAKE